MGEKLSGEMLAEAAAAALLLRREEKRRGVKVDGSIDGSNTRSC
jgi:hypothetical protein